MERWKRYNPSLHIEDRSSPEGLLVLSDDEVEALPSSDNTYHMPPLTDWISPVTTGQRVVVIVVDFLPIFFPTNTFFSHISPHEQRQDNKM